jgi:hypothetical protein
VKVLRDSCCFKFLLHILGLTLRGDCGLRVSENRVLRRMFGHKREGRENCIMRSFIICTLYWIYFRVIDSRLMSWAGHTACMIAMRNVYKISVGKSEEK